ncbi:hypothetical protein BJ165DRAFT_1485100, partial [Panaeolus papilionaceus]
EFRPYVLQSRLRLLDLVLVCGLIPSLSHVTTLNDPLAPRTMSTHFHRPKSFYQLDALYILLRIETDRDPDSPLVVFS